MNIGSNRMIPIKKTKPKVQKGDCFCLYINNLYYSGIVINNQFIKEYGDNVLFTIAVLNYAEKEIEHISKERVLSAFNKGDFLVPPLNINKTPWTNGHFLNISKIAMSELETKVLHEIRLCHYSKVYTIDHEEVSNIHDLRLVGQTGVYNDRGLEFLIQISLDLDFDESDGDESYYPYEFLDDLKERYPKLVLPFWYIKAQSRVYIGKSAF